jgi:hypothetical protein
VVGLPAREVQNARYCTNEFYHGGLGRPGRQIPGPRATQANSPTVIYAADAAPGLMKMASGLVDSDTEAGGGPEAVDPLRPRARPTVWPGLRPVPGLVAPRPRGSTRRLAATGIRLPGRRIRYS